MSEKHDESLGNIILHHVTNDNSYVYVPIEIGGLNQRSLFFQFYAQAQLTILCNLGWGGSIFS